MSSEEGKDASSISSTQNQRKQQNDNINEVDNADKIDTLEENEEQENELTSDAENEDQQSSVTTSQPKASDKSSVGEEDEEEDYSNEWTEPWTTCGGKKDQPNLFFLGFCFCEANQVNCESLEQLERMPNGGLRRPHCCFPYGLGVLGFWLPWRPETYLLRRAARKRYKIKGTKFEDCYMASACLCWCANCQIIRETQEHGDFIGYPAM